MGNETMTDARAIETICRVLNEAPNRDPIEAEPAILHIAARLRGEAAQGCGACGDGCLSRDACRLADESPSQGAAAGVPEADLIDAAMSVLNDNNGKIGKRKFRADATAVVRRVLRMLAAAPSAPTQGADSASATPR